MKQSDLVQVAFNTSLRVSTIIELLAIQANVHAVKELTEFVNELTETRCVEMFQYIEEHGCLTFSHGVGNPFSSEFDSVGLAVRIRKLAIELQQAISELPE